MKTVTLRGYICGPIWWPAGQVCGKPLSERIQRVDPMDVSKVRRSIYDVVADVLNDGDFQGGGQLTADSYFELVHERMEGNKRVTVSRIVEVSDLPSLVDLVDVEHFSSDFSPEF